MITIIEKTEGNKFEFKFQKADIMVKSIVGETVYEKQMKKFNTLLKLELEDHDFGEFDEKKKEAVSIMCSALYTIDFDEYAQAIIHSNIEFIAEGLFNLEEVKNALKNSDAKYFWTNFPTQLKEYLYAPTLDNTKFSYYVNKCIGKYEDSNELEKVNEIIPVNAEKVQSQEIINNASVNNELAIDVATEDIKDMNEEVKDLYDETNEIKLGAYLDKNQVSDFIYDKTGIELEQVAKSIVDVFQKISITNEDSLVLLSNLITNQDKLKDIIYTTVDDIVNIIEHPDSEKILRMLKESLNVLSDRSLTLDQRRDQIAAWFDCSMSTDEASSITIFTNLIKNYEKIKNILLDNIFKIIPIVLDKTQIDQELINKSIIDLSNLINSNDIFNSIISEAEKASICTDKIKETIKEINDLNKKKDEVNQKEVCINANKQTIDAQNNGKVIERSQQSFWDGTTPGTLIYG